MQLEKVHTTLVKPALALLPAVMRSQKAELLLLTIGLQESGFTHTTQVGGPAHGYWQFEQGGGVKGVLTHHSSRPYALDICHRLGVVPAAQSVYQALPYDHVLACVLARLLLWTDQRPMPAIGEVEQAWEYYLDNWRPGKPHPKTWAGFYAQAMDLLRDA